MDLFNTSNLILNLSITKKCSIEHFFNFLIKVVTTHHYLVIAVSTLNANVRTKTSNFPSISLFTCCLYGTSMRLFHFHNGMQLIIYHIFSLMFLTFWSVIFQSNFSTNTCFGPPSNIKYLSTSLTW